MHHLHKALQTLFLVGSLLMTMAEQAKAEITLQFANETGLEDGNVYIAFGGDPNQFDVTYLAKKTGKQMKIKRGSSTPPGAPDNAGKQPNYLSDPVALGAIKDRKLTINEFEAGVVYVSYGGPMQDVAIAPSPVNREDPDYRTPYQPFELTYMGRPTDQGNLTAINYFTAPMIIETFDSDGSLLEKRQFNVSTEEISQGIIEVIGSGSPAIVTDSVAFTDSSGKQTHKVVPIRFIGPSQYGVQDPMPYPSFAAYLTSLSSAGYLTKITNNNAYLVPATQKNFNFLFDFTAKIVSPVKVVVSGTFDVEITEPGKEPYPGPSFDCTMTVDAGEAAGKSLQGMRLMNHIIYGQAWYSDSTSFSGDWEKLQRYLETNQVPVTMMRTLRDTLHGDWTTGVLAGFANSKTIYEGEGPGNGKAIGTLGTKEWWQFDPMVAFSEVQLKRRRAPFFNAYADIIFTTSANQVYGIPYSDRLGDGPLVSSTEIRIDGELKKVASWQVTLQPPVSSFPLKGDDAAPSPTRGDGR